MSFFIFVAHTEPWVRRSFADRLT